MPEFSTFKMPCFLGRGQSNENTTIIRSSLEWTAFEAQEV